MSTEDSSTSPPKNNEIFESYFRGVWLPAHVCHLLFDGEINSTDLHLMVRIESLVKCRGKGCFASNSSLAEMIGIQPMRVSQTISKLKNLKLLKIEKRTYKGMKRRFLELSWSRVEGEITEDEKLETEELNKNPGIARRDTLGISRRDTHDREEEILVEKKVASPPPVAALPPDGSQRSSSPKTTKQKNSSKGRSTSPSVAALPRSEREDESPSKKGTVNSGSVAALPPLETTPLDKHTDKGLAPKSHLHTENASVGHIQDAADLYKCLRKALRENNIPPLDQSMKTGSAHLLELISKYGHSLEEVKETLEWYSRHCSRDDLKKYGLPTVQSCRQFAKHYEWIYNVKNSKKNRYSEETYDQW